MLEDSSHFSSCLFRLPSRGWWALTLLVLSVFAASPTSADPELTIESAPLGDGLTGWNVGIAFDDGEALSTFVDVTFEGHFNHLLYDGVAVDTDVEAASFDGLLGYEAALDSYFTTSVWPDVVLLEGGEVMSVIYELAAGSGAGNPVEDFIELAYLVLPEGESFTYYAIVSRQGVNYTLVPEPSPSLLALVAIGTLAALRRQQGKLRDRVRSTMETRRSPRRRRDHLALFALLAAAVFVACGESSTESLDSVSPIAATPVSSTSEMLPAQSVSGSSNTSQPASVPGAVDPEEYADLTEASAQQAVTDVNDVLDKNFTTWKENYLRTVDPGTLGDHNLDGRVDGADYTIWADAGIESLVCPNYFPNGVAAGDVDQSSVVLWTRAASGGKVRFEWGRDPDFSGLPDGVQIRDVVVDADESDKPVTIPTKVDVSGLLPGTRYYYRACRGSACQTSAPPGCEVRGSFRTPFASDYHGLHFGVSSCFRGNLKPYVSIKNVPDLDLDFFVALGDTAYADSSDSGGQAKTLFEFRAKHELGYSQLNTPEENRALTGSPIDDNYFALARASTAFFANIDDHEVVDNFAGGALPITHKQSVACKLIIASDTDPFLKSRCLSICDPANDPNNNCGRQFINETDLFKYGLQAWYEYNPVRKKRYGATGDGRTRGKSKLYRHRTFGKDAALIMLDARSFRDKEQFVLGVDPTRTMLGKAQLTDLKKDLQAAENNGITWKLVLIPEPIQNLDPLTALDRFEGYDHERQEILDFIEDKCISNVVFISGDIHGTVVNNLSYKKPPLFLRRFGSSWDISTGPVAYAEPLGRTVTKTATNVTDRNLLDELFQLALDAEFYTLSLPKTGLDPEQPQDFLIEPLLWQYRAEVDATLLQGSYVSAHTYGWTEFEIDATTQKLVVTTHGIDWYEDNSDLNDLLSREPFIASQFEIEPKFGCQGGMPNGNLCSDDTMCQSRLCNVGICTSPQPNGNVCVRDEGCISGLCNAGICTDPQPNGNVCVRDEGCISGLCNAGFCTEPQPNGNACVQDEGCISGLCNAGICTSPQPNGNLCTRDEGCISGLCNAGICTEPQPNGYICVRDDVCQSGICNAGICTSLQPNGNVCVRDDGCQSGLCNAGFCTEPQPDGNVCVQDEGCISGLCNAGICTSPQPNGNGCLRDEGCISGLCNAGICTSLQPNGNVCVRDDGCQSGLCNAGICTALQPNGNLCVRDDGCQSGLCNVGICMSPQANGSACVRDVACQSGLCNAGTCTSPQANGSICIRHDGCRSGLCDLGFCTAPNSKSFLTPCGSGRACISGTCRTGLCRL